MDLLSALMTISPGRDLCQNQSSGFWCCGFRSNFTAEMAIQVAKTKTESAGSSNVDYLAKQTLDAIPMDLGAQP